MHQYVCPLSYESAQKYSPIHKVEFVDISHVAATLYRECYIAFFGLLKYISVNKVIQKSTKKVVVIIASNLKFLNELSLARNAANDAVLNCGKVFSEIGSIVKNGIYLGDE